MLLSKTFYGSVFPALAAGVYELIVLNTSLKASLILVKLRQKSSFGLDEFGTIVVFN